MIQYLKKRCNLSPIELCYWLQGYFELTDSGKPLSAQQAQIIKDHLELVFKKETPRYNLSYTGIHEYKDLNPVYTNELGWQYTPSVTYSHIETT